MILSIENHLTREQQDQIILYYIQTSPYPVILSIEKHLTREQQDQIILYYI